MSFVRTATKRFKDIPHHDTCMCGDCPTESGVTLERVEMWKILDQCMVGEKVTILVRGKRRTITAISYIFDRMDVTFSNGEKHLMRPEDEVKKINGVTK